MVASWFEYFVELYFYPGNCFVTFFYMDRIYRYIYWLNLVIYWLAGTDDDACLHASV